MLLPFDFISENRRVFMQIVLNDKTFVAPSPKARAVRKAIELTKNIDFNDLAPENLDTLVGYVVDLFDKQFTIDDVYDGMDAEQLIPTLMECISSVVGKIGAKLEQFPKNVSAGA